MEFIKNIVISFTMPLLYITSFRNFLMSYCFLGTRANSSNFFAKLCRFIFWANYQSFPQKGKIEVQQFMMGGNLGAEWAEYYQSNWTLDNFPPPIGTLKIGDLDYREACPFFNFIEEILRDAKERFLCIQLGASSGKEIAYFANNFPGHDFLYTDIYTDVTNKAIDRYSEITGLKFCTCSGVEIASNINGARNVIIFSHGSAQYLLPEDIKLFFESFSNITFNKIYIVICEPVSSKNIDPMNFEGSYFRGNFSYTHNYSWYATSANFKTIILKNIKPYADTHRFPMHKHTSHVFGCFLKDIR